MNRREFMIAGAGLLITSGGLVIANDPQIIPTVEELIKRTQRVFSLSDETLMAFKMIARTKERELIIDMDSVSRKDGHIDFVSAELPVDTWLGAMLIDDENWLVRQKSGFKTVEREKAFQVLYRHDWRNV